jgi:choline dehydrogenase-like flavoprotein
MNKKIFIHMKENWKLKDIIIIGSGIGGLVVGNLLAKRGYLVGR